MRTLAEDLLVLLLDEHTGGLLIDVGDVKYALAAATVADLVQAGRLRVTDRGRVEVVDATPVGRAVPDAVLRTLAADRPRNVHAVLVHLARPVRDGVVDALVDGGVLRRENGRVVAFPPRARPRDELAAEAELRAAVIGIPPSDEARPDDGSDGEAGRFDDRSDGEATRPDHGFRSDGEAVGSNGEAFRSDGEAVEPAGDHERILAALLGACGVGPQADPRHHSLTAPAGPPVRLGARLVDLFGTRPAAGAASR